MTRPDATQTLPSLGSPAARSRGEGIVARLTGWHARWSARRSLDTLPDHLLRDIGVTRDQARSESEKPFWRD